MRETNREDCGGGFKNKGDIEAVAGCIQLKIRETRVVIHTDLAIVRNRKRRILLFLKFTKSPCSALCFTI